MNRKTFYIFIALIFSALFIYTLLSIFILKHMGIQTYRLQGFKNQLALVILIFEIADSGKIMRIAGFSLLALNVIGFLFRIMHWPFGTFIFIGSFLFISIGLIISALANKSNRLDKLVILIYPISRVLLMSHYFSYSNLLWWITDVIAVGGLAIFLWVQFAGLKLKR